MGHDILNKLDILFFNNINQFYTIELGKPTITGEDNEHYNVEIIASLNLDTEKLTKIFSDNLEIPLEDIYSLDSGETEFKDFRIDFSKLKDPTRKVLLKHWKYGPDSLHLILNINSKDLDVASGGICAFWMSEDYVLYMTGSSGYNKVHHINLSIPKNKIIENLIIIPRLKIIK